MLESRARIDDLERSNVRQIERCDKLERDLRASREKEIAKEQGFVELKNLLETELGISSDRWTRTEEKLELVRGELQNISTRVQLPKVDPFGATHPEQEPGVRTLPQCLSTNIPDTSVHGSAFPATGDRTYHPL